MNEIEDKDTHSQKLVEAFDEWSESINTDEEEAKLFLIISSAVKLREQLIEE